MTKHSIHCLQVGSKQYRMSGTDSDIALAHALGSAFVELQQLEFTLISYVISLTDKAFDNHDVAFEVFSSKTFGNLIREMEKNTHLRPLALELSATKTKRDFFVHKFLFNRYGGEFTSEEEYEGLIADAVEVGDCSRTRERDFMISCCETRLLKCLP